MLKKKRLVIWGSSGHALVVADIVRLQDEYEIVGFIDSVNPVHPGATSLETPILGGEEQLATLRQKGIEHLIFGLGDCRARLKLSDIVRSKGFHLAIAIHPHAVIAQNVAVGPGTVIAAGAVVNPGSRIGENVIINTAASIDHECTIEDGVHISPGVHLAGKVTVGRATWIGIGTTVIDRIRIGTGAVIGAGSVVIRDIPDEVVAFGVPARVQRKLAVNG